MTHNRPLIRHINVTRSSLFKARPSPGGDSAIVILDKHGKLYQLTRPLTAGEIAWDTPRTVFEVDISVHSLSFDLQLPAVEKAFSFQARVVVHWRITDAKAAVEAKLSNPDLVVTSSVEQRLREITQRFAIEDSAAAENAIRVHFAMMPVPLSQGVALVECVVSLSLDQSTAAHVASRTHAKWERETLQSRHETTQLNTTLAIQQGTAQQMFEAEQAKLTQEMAAQAERHKLELEQMNMQFYSQALSEGNLNLIALRLSTNPDDVNDVINLFMRQRQLDYEGAKGMLDSLLENRLVNKRDVADIMARATSVVADHMTRAPFDLAGIEGQSSAPESNSPTVPAVDDIPVTIYLSDASAHNAVELAVEALLHTAQVDIVARDEPVIGSWFRRLWARTRNAFNSDLMREASVMAAHALDSRIVLAQDATITATMMQNLGSVLTALQTTKDAVIRVGALLIVKVDWTVSVHQLTASQQLVLDHQPHLLSSPHDILDVVNQPALPTSSGGEG